MTRDASGFRRFSITNFHFRRFWQSLVALCRSSQPIRPTRGLATFVANKSQSAFRQPYDSLVKAAFLPFFGLLWLITNCQLPNCLFQRSCFLHTLRRCQSVGDSQTRINSETGQWKSWRMRVPHPFAFFAKGWDRNIARAKGLTASTRRW
jgi:hypothetical protein